MDMLNDSLEKSANGGEVTSELWHEKSDLLEMFVIDAARDCISLFCEGEAPDLVAKFNALLEEFDPTPVRIVDPEPYRGEKGFHVRLLNVLKILDDFFKKAQPVIDDLEKYSYFTSGHILWNLREMTDAMIIRPKVEEKSESPDFTEILSELERGEQSVLDKISICGVPFGDLPGKVRLSLETVFLDTRNFRNMETALFEKVVEMAEPTGGFTDVEHIAERVDEVAESREFLEFAGDYARDVVDLHSVNDFFIEQMETNVERL